MDLTRCRTPALVALLLVTCSSAPSAAAAAGERVVLSEGHTDALDVRDEGATLELDVKDDTVEPSVYRDPADVIFHAKPESELTIPEGLPPDYAFLGAAGDSVWILPQVQDANLLWPGWETTRLAFGGFPSGELTWRLVDFDGPGDFWLYVEGALGNPDVRFDTADGVDVTTMATHTHAHANWAFSAPGLYTLTFQVQGVRAGGSTVASRAVDYRFFVGDLADLPELPDTALAISGAQAEYRAGDTMSLTATQQPDTGLAGYRWFERCGAARRFTAIADGPTLTRTAATEQDGCDVRVHLYEDGDALVARSTPVTLRVGPASDLQPAPPAPDAPAPAPAAETRSTPPLKLALRRRVKGVRIRAMRRTGTISLLCGMDAPGRCSVRATIGPATAKRLGLRTTRLGRGDVELAKAGRRVVSVKLNRQARRAMRRARGRVRIRLTATGSAHGRAPATLTHRMTAR